MSFVLPDPFPPPWASEWEEDAEWGLAATLNLDGLTQTFRWIQPGTFKMGSSSEEVGRFNGETQHDVTLTRGFWLADTACTLALWHSVMPGDRAPSSTDSANPVDWVSWDEVRVFLKLLNARMPVLNASLPSEAQWEYACRAGTETPFSFGAEITPEQVNYDGNYPYARGKTGLSRGGTVPVKSLPPNKWGLYEMHGNVLEWCADWHDDYPAGLQIDPSGPLAGLARVLRGGAWTHHAVHCRAAARGGNIPEARGRDIGFRLALG